MNSTTYITLDMQAPETGVIAYAKQNDKLSRRLSATLKDGATSWTPPTGAAAAIRYSKPDGTGGFYDVLEDSSPAIVVSGNVALMTLAEQCVTVPGAGSHGAEFLYRCGRQANFVHVAFKC